MSDNPSRSDDAAPADAASVPSARRETVTEDWRVPRLSARVTGVFAVMSVAASVWSSLVVVSVGLDLVMFVSGVVAFGWAYFRAIGRSREEVISLGGLFFLGEGVAPRPVAVGLWLAFVVQVVVAVVVAAVHPYSSLAFGILAPMFGLAMLPVWGASRGTFPPVLGKQKGA